MSHTGEGFEGAPTHGDEVDPTTGARLIPDPDTPVSIEPRHRFAAVGALVLFALAVVAFAIGFVRGFPLVLVPLAFFAPGVFCVWKALTHRALRRYIYLALGVAAAILALVGLGWIITDYPILLLFLVFSFMGAGLAGSALSWIHQPAGHLVRPARHPVLIVNPHSGDGAAERAGLSDEARRRGIDVIELGPDDDLLALAENAVKGGADCIGMAGGDGSLALVASVAIDAHVPFVCVPAGTRNHFALDLGLDRTDPLAALDSFGEAVQRRIDVAEVNGRLFLNNVSIGAYGEVVSSEDYRDNKIGVALQTLPDLIGPDAEPLDLQFTDDTGTSHERAIVIHVSNNSYDLVPRLGFSSRPSLIDGELGILAAIQPEEGGTPRILQWQEPEFVVGSADKIASGIDGEFVELDPPVRFRVRALALRVRMPRDVAGVSPGAKRAALTMTTLRRLWAVARNISPVQDVPARAERPGE